MLILLSPAKTIDESPAVFEHYTQPKLLEQSQQLIDVLRQKSIDDIKTLMGISDKLAIENVGRYQSYSTPFSLETSKQAIFAFKGGVYQGLDIDTFSDDDLLHSQEVLRILSGLYGVLSPLDLMFPYRLEMGTKLDVATHKNLYQFWGNTITDKLNELASPIIVNLASIEYFKSVNKKELNGQLIQIDFKENRNGKYKVIAFNAKKARGAMAGQIIKNRLTSVEQLKELTPLDYTYNIDLSTDTHLVFTK